MFIPNPNNYRCINHKDENKKNNKADNLEWCTVAYNNSYGKRLTKIANKLSREINQYDIDGKFIKKWKSFSEIVRQLNFKQIDIWLCCNLRRKSAYGYKWQYANPTPEELEKYEAYKKARNERVKEKFKGGNER